MSMNKKPFSEEELAAYIDGTLPESRKRDVESSLTDDMLELIGVTKAALGKVPGDNVVPFPEWGSVKPSSHLFDRSQNPLAMAGFLGDDESEDTVDGTENEGRK